MKKCLLLLLLGMLAFASYNPAEAQCNWKSRGIGTNFWDSCKVGANSLNAYIAFKTSTSCFKYKWTVNGVITSNTSNIFKYNITKNDTYIVCVKVIDTCNNCDTIFCSQRIITCISSGNSGCIWKSRYPTPKFWDSCTTTSKTINGYIPFNYGTSCFRYEWTVNGNNVGSNKNNIYYPVTQNGSYNLCVKVTDTCNNCDTVFCSSRSVTCFSNGNTCNWKSRKTSASFWDSCTNTSKSINGIITIDASFASCCIYQWAVNGVKVGNNSQYINYPVTQNGNYNLCVKVIDTCNNCDTVFCSSRSVTCFSNNTPCNWKSRYPTPKFWDSCTTTSKTINGYIPFNYGTSCFRYEWTVNGNNVGSNKNNIYYPVTQNGSYNLCVKVTDTCNNCDTVFCSTRTVSCFSNSTPCNWQSKRPGSTFWDSCKVGVNSLNAYIVFNSNTSCLIYKWTVNGVPTNINSNLFKYNITKNDTYSVCVKVTDTCNNCDTIFCSQRVITCISNNNTCNWSSRYPNTKFWDSCTNTSKTLNGYVSFNSPNAKCYKYQFTINGIKVGNGTQYIYYPITQNGSYNICVKVTDTCNNCDTVFCSTKTITCFSGGSNGCNWSNRQMNNMVWDSCNATKKTVNAYISFNSGSSCLRYEWKVNNNFAGKGMAIYYPITQNGTYDICVKVTDTCKLCDTIYCFTKTINCFNGINNSINESNIDIYPNPANESVTIDWAIENSNYYIVNISGQQVLTGKLNQGKQSIDLSKYPEGVYFIRIQTSQDIITKKIIIQKN